MKTKKCLWTLLALLWVTPILFAQIHDLGSIIQCTDCHKVMSSNLNAPLLVDGFASVENMCYSCHDGSGVGPTEGTHAEIHKYPTYGAGSETCITCHNPHRKNTLPNIRLIRTTINTPDSQTLAVQFEDDTEGSSEFVLRGTVAGKYGICEVCHLNTTHDKRNAPYVDHDGTLGSDCTTSCHSHTGNFIPSGGSGCIGCHKNPKGTLPRRAITQDFDTAGHDFHGKSPTSDDQCKVCHVEDPSNGDYKHKDGWIDLWNHNNGGSEYRVPEQNKNFANMSESTKDGIMTNVCLTCHDNDGADPDIITYAGTGGSTTNPFNQTGGDDPSGVWLDRFDIKSRGTSQFSSHPIIEYDPSNYLYDTNFSNVDFTTNPAQNIRGMYNNKTPINCWWCHESNGHGAPFTDILLDETYADQLATYYADKSTNVAGTAQNTFCTRCHISTTYIDGNTPKKPPPYGDAHFQGDHGTGQHHDYQGCRNCHAGLTNTSTSKNSDNYAGKSKIHGASETWTADHSPYPDATVEGPSDLFLHGGWLSLWTYGGGSQECWGGDCNHANGRGY